MNTSAAISRPQDIVDSFLKAFWAGEYDDAAALVAEDAVWHVDGDPGVPPTGLRHGRHRVRQWMDVFPGAFEPRGGSVLTTMAQGDDVLVCGRFHFLVRPTGKVVQGDYVMRFTVRGQLIARYQMFEDSLALASAFDVLPTQPLQPAAQRIRVNDTVYGYDDTGDGPAVMFLHGLFGDRTMFQHQVAALRPTHRCVVLDMPGHGASAVTAQGWSLEDIAADLALLIEEKNWGPLAVVGHSQGGTVAMLLAAHRPDLVKQVALVNSSARPEPEERHDLWRQRRSVLSTGSGEQQHALMREIQKNVTSARWRTNHPAPAADELHVMTSQDPLAMGHALEAAVLERRDVRHLLPAVQARTLVLAGAEDHAMPPALSEEIATLVDDSDFVVLPDVAHHAPAEAPQEVTHCLQRLLDGADAK